MNFGLFIKQRKCYTPQLKSFRTYSKIMKTFLTIYITAAICIVSTAGHGHRHYNGWHGNRYSHSHGSGWSSGSTGWTSPSPPDTGDTRSLDQLYRLALAEGGNLIVYAGGDSAGQMDEIKAAFESRFPNIKAEMIVDFSKNHDVRIDRQLSEGKLIPDVTHLSSVHDFPRWKKEGVLLQYKPAGWDQVHPEFKDADGFFTGLVVVAFSNNINRDLLGNNSATWPTEANDYLRPSLKGKIVSEYPQEDDVALFWFKKVVDKYGWSWLQKFVANNPTFVRGAQIPSEMVWDGVSSATFTTDGMMKPKETYPVQFVLPKADPFVSFAQLGAIFKNAKHPAAAKLYLSWRLSYEMQNDVWYMWSVRKDVPVPEGYKGIFNYKGQTDPREFAEWMEDRAAVERFRTQVTLIVGEMVGPSPPGNLGPYPAKALQH